jgi:hypothetical protein
MTEDPDFSNQGLLLLTGNYPVTQRVLYENAFGWELEIEDSQNYVTVIKGCLNLRKLCSYTTIYNYS